MEARLFGQIPDGLDWRRDRSIGTLRPGRRHRCSNWRTVSPGYAGHQRYWVISHRITYGVIHGAASTSSQLAPSSCRWLFGWVHHILDLRVRDLPRGAGWRQMDWPVERGWKCGAGIHRRLDRGSDCGPAIMHKEY